MAVRELSRRAVVKGGGALLVALAVGGPGAPHAAAADPDSSETDSYLAVHADGTVSVITGRVELGQGSTTGLALLVAEELDADLSALRFVRHDTRVSPDTGGTFGSSSIASAGGRLRAACAAARQVLLQLGSQALGVPVTALATGGGAVSARRPLDHVRRAARRPGVRGRAAGSGSRRRPGSGQADRPVPPGRELADRRASTSRRR